jgi:hypothetical protein
MVQERTPRLTLSGGEGGLDASLTDSLWAATLSNNYYHIGHEGQKDTTMGNCDIICTRRYLFVNKYFPKS